MTTGGNGTVIGVDGGGTWTRLALADREGHELVRTTGQGTLVDPAEPSVASSRLIELVQRLAAEAEVQLPVSGLCAGLAGTGDPQVRSTVHDALAEARVAQRVEIVTDGELALAAALGEQAGIVLVAGTGSVAYGRSERGEVARCGGWGLVLGDEGSGYAIARGGLHGLLRSADGRAGPTELLPRLLAELGLERPEQVPAWSARTDKGGIAALAPMVVELAEAGDPVARRVVDDAARDLARHVKALLDRLDPWSEPVPVVFLGSVLEQPGLARRVEERLDAARTVRRSAREDAVTAAVHRAMAFRSSE